MKRVFAAIDLKSFYASVECNERNLDPLTTNLVVADETRTDQTICLAVSPSLKSYGIPGRARLFQVKQKVAEVNRLRQKQSSLGVFLGKSINNPELQQNPNLALDFIIAPPRMQYYLDYSAKIYQIYLQHLAPDDIFAYSIDEVFCDLTSYLKMHDCSAAEFVSKMIRDVYMQTGITATAGIGTNLFLAKVAMDILAKHAAPNLDGVRLAELNERTFREQLWPHQPITDFWRVGRGYAKRLAKYNLTTMGDVARCSLENPELLYQLFGINAELLIDHSWGYEPVQLSDVKTHQPEAKSISSGQVLSRPYTFKEAQTIIREMADSLALELVEKQFLTNHLTLGIEYDHENSASESIIDRYNRRVPKPLQATTRLDLYTSSTQILTNAFLKTFRAKAQSNFTIRKIYLAANDLLPVATYALSNTELTQADLFIDYNAEDHQRQKLEKEHRAQKAILEIRKRYGKNAILHGTSFEPEATGRNRHRQIGGHKA